MSLTLTVVRAPAGVAPGQRHVAAGCFSIGRDGTSDWPLPDPDRVLSKRHCEMVAEGTGWSLTDLSSNGTALNGVDLEPGNPQPLRDGDRMRIGPYEIEVRIDGAPSQDTTTNPFAGADRASTGDPFTPFHAGPVEAAPGIGLPAAFDPLASADAMPAPVYAPRPDASDLHSNFRPPRSEQDVLPADWDEDEAEPQPAPQAAPAPADAPGAEPGDAAASFAAGAGLTRPFTLSAAAMADIGAAFRAVVSGLRRMMIARATVKGEFRIAQTMIRAKGNNPLKFSADDDDALAGLLGLGRDAGMSPARSIDEAFRDMRLHELAVATAMQQSVRELLGSLSPDRIMRAEPQTAVDKLLGLRKRAAWDSYRRVHADIMRALEDDFDSAFGKAFGRAYEAALESLAAQDVQSLEAGHGELP